MQVLSTTLHNIVTALEKKKIEADQCAASCAMQYAISQSENDRELCIQFLEESEVWQKAIQIVNQNRS